MKEISHISGSDQSSYPTTLQPLFDGYAYANIRSQKKQRPITGIQRNILMLKRQIKDLRIAIKCYRSVFRGVHVGKKLKLLFRDVFGSDFYPKVVKVGRHYYGFPYTPAWGTEAYKRDLRTHLHDAMIHQQDYARLLVVLFSITHQCPLRCEHCFEWDNLNQQGQLTLEELEHCIVKIQSQGAISIHLSGGEPMLRINEIMPLVKKYSKASAFWLLTSGILINHKKAKEMKESGISIVSLSLDHYMAEEHDRFRGMKGSFKQVMKAAKHCIDNDIYCMLNVCINKEKVNRDFLLKYMDLAKDMGVACVQILEPRSIGHYKGKKVELGQKEIDLLESFYLEMNNSKEFMDYPIIVYHGYQQRRVGCFSAGKYNVYIDANGDVMTCTFCRRKEGNVLKEDLGQIADRMAERGCRAFS